MDTKYRIRVSKEGIPQVWVYENSITLDVMDVYEADWISLLDAVFNYYEEDYS